MVFAKAPVIGGAKTRLAAGIGKVAAWRRHRAMMAVILRKVRDPRWESVLAVSPDRAIHRRFPGVWPKDIERTAQGGGDLGARQARVFTAPCPTLVIGTDAPQITRGDIARAFAALKRHDAVIGPAEDGGYWLLGLARPAPAGLFDAIRWSHGRTRADLEARLAAFGLSRIARLRRLRDVDHADDLGAMKREDRR
ncbi:TIGR04282 family arsenosugar biosynthesis glycosyltransferase [Maricaulaceae bacterium MS644]